MATWDPTTHPELQLGEIWITNTRIEPPRPFRGRYPSNNLLPPPVEDRSLRCKTRRVGNQAYNAFGEPMGPETGYRPVFIQKSEEAIYRAP